MPFLGVPGTPGDECRFSPGEELLVLSGGDPDGTDAAHGGQFDGERADRPGRPGDREELPLDEPEQVQRLRRGPDVRGQGGGLLRWDPGRGGGQCAGLTDLAESLTVRSPESDRKG